MIPWPWSGLKSIPVPTFQTVSLMGQTWELNCGKTMAEGDVWKDEARVASESSMNSAWVKKNRQELPNPLKKAQKWESQPTTGDRGLGCEQRKACLPDNKKDTTGPLTSGARKASTEGMVGLGLFSLKSIPHCSFSLSSDMGKLILTGCISLIPISPGFLPSLTTGDADRTEGKGKKESREILSYFASDNISSKGCVHFKAPAPNRERPLGCSLSSGNTASSPVPLA